MLARSIAYALFAFVPLCTFLGLLLADRAYRRRKLTRLTTETLRQFGREMDVPSGHATATLKRTHSR